MEKKLEGIVKNHEKSSSSLIAVLQDVQKEYGYLPCDVLKEVASWLEVPLSKVFSVSTFYNAFSLNKKGDVVVKICTGTACHIRGAANILDEFVAKLKVEPGATTADGKFTVETVNCLGACAMAPLLAVNEKYVGKAKIQTVSKIISGEL